MITTICVCGAGTMGSGIAQVAAMGGFTTILFDVNAAALEKAKALIARNLDYLVAKEKISYADKERIASNLQYVSDLSLCRGDLIIEAIIEKEEAKVQLINSLSQYNQPFTIYASNTSSLSINSLQNKVKVPELFLGMHFFNPAYIMKLVEVVAGHQTKPEVIEEVVELCKKLGKSAVVCKDSPGFIVNRVARHFYLESLKIAEDGIAGFEEIDTILEATGFKMGPFALMDLIGMDINLAVSQGLYEAFDEAPRFKPNKLQIEKVNNKELGKKTGKGFYDYSKKEPK